LLLTIFGHAIFFRPRGTTPPSTLRTAGRSTDEKERLLPALTAPASAATAPTAAATRPSTAAAIATAPARRLGPSLIHVERPSMQLGSVQMGDSSFRLVRIGHFHKRESARLAGAAVGHDIYTLDGPILGEGRHQLVLSGLVAEVPHENIGHEIKSPFG
jgi:hypothetical protein